MDYATHFSSVDEFLEAVQKPSDMSFADRASRGGFSDSFYGSITYDDAVSACRLGWREGASLLRNESQHLKLIGKELSYTADVTGEFLDLGRYLQGSPECWLTETLDEGAVRFVEICVAVAVSAYVSQDDVIRRGAAICNLIDSLESQGVRVRVTCYYAVGRLTRHEKKVCGCTVVLKQFNQPLDIDRMAFCLAHVAFVRRLMFSFLETHSPAVRKACDISPDEGYGAPQSVRYPGCSKDVLFLDSNLQFADDKEACTWLDKKVSAMVTK